MADSLGFVTAKDGSKKEVLIGYKGMVMLGKGNHIGNLYLRPDGIYWGEGTTKKTSSRDVKKYLEEAGLIQKAWCSWEWELPRISGLSFLLLNLKFI